MSLLSVPASYPSPSGLCAGHQGCDQGVPREHSDLGSWLGLADPGFKVLDGHTVEGFQSHLASCSCKNIVLGERPGMKG